jgi:hypothetical protein
LDSNESTTLAGAESMTGMVVSTVSRSLRVVKTLWLALGALEAPLFSELRKFWTMAEGSVGAAPEALSHQSISYKVFDRYTHTQTHTRSSLCARNAVSPFPCKASK